MTFNVPEDQKPEFNKNVQKSLGLLTKDVERTLGQLKVLQPQTLVDAYNQPVQAPVTRDLTPLEQYVYEPQPVQEVDSITEMPAKESMVVPQDQPKMLSNFRNQANAKFGGDMVSITPEQQATTDLIGAEIDSLRNDAGEIASSPLEVFAKPLDANKVKALGFVDAEGNPTERGQLFYNLQQSGMFNEDGTITERGQAYLMPMEEIGKEENLKAFQILWDDEVIRPNATFGEIASNTGKFVVDAALGGAKRIGQEAQSFWYNSQTWDSALGKTDLRPQELRDKMTASGLGLVEGAVENLAGWAGIADVGSSWIGKKLYDVLPAGMEEEAEQALYAARQRQWQTQQNIANLSTGEIAEAVLGMDNAVAEAESAKSRIGKEEFDKQYGQTSAFSQLALDPTNAIPASIAAKAARTAPLANRVAITAQKRMAKIAAQDLAIAEAQTAIEAANSVLKKEAATVSVANRLAEDISTRAGANPELVARANQASQVAGRITESANQIRSTLPSLTAELDGMIAKRNSLATRIPEAYSQKVLQTMELGRQVRSMPAKAVGATLERVGDTISKTDTAITNYLQDRGLDQMYTAAVGAAGVMGLAGSPVIGAIGAGAAALKTGKVLSNYGKLFRYVGKEMENVRGQIPFWKRVAAHTAPGSFGRGVAHTFNMLDLGGVTSDTIRRAGRGIAAAAPTDLMFEYLSDGADMRPETLYQAGAESFFIGGSFAAGGGAFMGTKKRMRELSIGDELNFRRDLTDPRQKALFEAIPAGTRRAISTYAIANPTLNYIFKDSGASRYDPNTNTAVINVRSTNPIKALVAHETLHHTLIKNNMENGIAALFLGDTKNNTVGGLFRSRDGKLDPNFEAFKDAYYKRLGVEGMSNAERDAIYPLDKIAVEYFIEKHADQYAAMAESGELGAVAASGAARRKLGSILETVLPRVPVLKDLHFKSGGMIDANGAWVTGNGILDAEGVKRDPITSKMFRDMNRRSAGLVPGQFEPLMSDKPDSGAPIILNPADGIDAELLHPLVKVDDTGRPIMQDGKPVALDRATELERALAGLTAKEVLQRKRDENYAPEKGEAHIDDEGQFQPGWLSNDVLTEMFAKNKYNPEQKRIIREMNKLVRKGAGDRVVMINFPATTRNKAGKVVYKPQAATLRDTVPVSITISKDGNLLFGLMSVTKLHENIQKRSQSKRGKKLYGGNVDLILRDTQAMMDYHKQGVDSLEYFSKKYGAVEADERKKFINTMFGLLNQKEQAVLNPMLLEDGVKSRDNVYRTYRADRVSKAVPMSPEEYPAMPFSYEAVSQVRMPEQRQMPDVSPEDLNPVANKQEAQGLWADGKRMFALNEMDEKLTPITSKAMLDSYSADAIGWMEPEAQKTGLLPDWVMREGASDKRFMPEKIDADYMKAVESGDVGEQQRIVDEAAKRAGYDIGPVYHGSAQRFNEFKPQFLGTATGGKSAKEAFFFSTSDRTAKNYASYASEEGPIKELMRKADQAEAQGDWDLYEQLLTQAEDLDFGPNAQQLREQRREQSAVYNVYLKGKFLEMDAEGMTPAELSEAKDFKEFDGSLTDSLQSAKRKGYDGVVFKNLDDAPNLSDPSDHYAVFDPKNIKLSDPITRDDSGNIIPPSKRFDITSKDLRFMPEKEIPVAKTTSESLEDSENKELISTGVDVPESVDDQSVISNAIKVANSQPWRKGRDFKLDLQRRVLDAAKQAGVNISERTLESIEYLARVGFKDALIALEQNPNAIGWYDEKTKQALGVMSLLFPEIATNENARFAFTWALAVTSNGLKVDKNFELAERVYRQYRKTGKMPTDIKAGQAQEAINDGLGLFNKLTKEWGVDNTRKFMQTDFTVGEISRLSKDLSPGGEFSDTSVRGSAILGPKIGNGFFSNLYGLFDALTMDRWLVRTWGRWTGTLVELNPELTKQATDRLREAVKNLTPEDKARMDEMIKNDISKMDINDLSVAIQKASMKPSLRDLMNKTPTGEEFRKSGNGLAKYLDGQKEAPANPAERNFIREIFGLMLDELRADPRYKDLTMADLQAVLWYAEKRLYETAKVNTDQKDLDSSDADGYEDDEAPDYANAAVGVAKKQGISEKRINQILEKVKNERATTTQLEVEGRSEDQLRQQESAGGFTGREKQKFKQYVAVTTTRRNRTGNEKALWSYQTKSGVDSGDAGLLKPKAKKNLGVKYISEWKPGRKLSTIFRNNNLPTVKFLELDSTDTVSAQKFADTIQQSKDESPHGAAVYVYPTEEYQGMKLFLSDSGKSGFAVKPDGDIVSVFSMEKGSGRSIMEAAISAGGKKLDAFDTILPEFYGTHGFVEAARMPWNDEFAPDGWDKQTFKEFNNGEPDVVMMVLDPSFDGEYTPRKDIYTTDYDQAVEMQDAMLKKVGRKKPAVKPSQPAPQKTTKKSQAKGDSSAIANAAKLK